MRTRIRLVAGVGLFTIALAWGLLAVDGSSSEARSPGLHIAARALSPEEVAVGQAIDVRYFGSFADAVDFASGGAVLLPEGLGPADVTQQQLAAGGAAASSTAIIGFDYDATYYDSSSGTITWYTSNPSGCSGGATFVANAMPAGWDNRVSSARGLSGCNTYRHYQHASLGGAYITCNCLTMGIMDNQTSSESWAP